MSENDRRIDVSLRDDGVVILKFNAMDRIAADEFAVITQHTADNVPDKMRTLYDARLSEPPTKYFINMQAKLYKAFPHPEDAKSAYLIEGARNAIWLRILRHQYRSQDEYKIFYDFDEAIAWLQE